MDYAQRNVKLDHLSDIFQSILIRKGKIIIVTDLTGESLAEFYSLIP
jgi:hypothetical protein